MNIEQLRNYCLTKKGVTESFPFDNNVLVFKVMNKMFLLTSLSTWEKGEGSMNVKCNPEKAITLREMYESVTGAFHMNKKHWNSVQLTTGEISDDVAQEFIDHSYNLVVKGLTKKQQKALQ